jgi:hypothetical protein
MIGYDEIEAALDRMLDELGAVGPPDGSPEPVEVWLREQGIDEEALRHAAAHAVFTVPAIARPVAMATWIEGFTIGWMLRRQADQD